MPASLVTLPRSAAIRALDRAITEAQADDPFAAVTVITASARAAIHLGRDLSRLRSRADADSGSRGLLNVNFLTLSRIAEDLGNQGLHARGLRRLTRTTLMATIRAELAARPRVFGAATPHPSTAAEIADRYGELRFAGAIASSSSSERPLGARALALRGICQAVRARVEVFSYDDVDLFEAAAGALRLAGESELGEVLVYLPERARTCELELLQALSERQSVKILLARSDVEAADEATNVLAGRIAARLGVGVVASARDASPTLTLPDRVIIAPSPRGEARAAVRIVLERLEAGIEPARIAIVTAVHEPYLGLVTGELSAAGVLYNASASTRLTEAAPGRVLVELIGLATRPIRRHDLMALLRGAPVLAGDGRRVPVGEWDRVSKLAGITEGTARAWSQRLREYAAYQGMGADGDADEGGDRVEAHRSRSHDRNATAALGLAAFVDDLEIHLAAGRAAKGWAQIATWANSALDALLGARANSDEVDESPLDPRGLVDAVLDELALLDELEADEDFDAALPVLVEELRRLGPRSGRTGGGVVVASLEQVMGVDLDVAVLVGCSAANLPGSSARSPLLDPSDRDVLGLDPITPRALAARVERQLWLLRCAATTFVATVPAFDSGGREMGLSRFVSSTAATSSIQGLLAELHGTLSGAWARNSAELETAMLFAGAPGSVALRAERLGLFDVSLAAHAALARERRQFGPFQGVVAPIEESSADRPYSPTSIEEVASCPFRYYLSHVLGVEAIDDPEIVTSIDPRSRGSIVHETLERFVGEEIAGRLELADGRERLSEIADEVIATYERAGKTGKRVLLHAERRRIKADLEAERERDLARRAVSGERPLEVEYGFGYGDVPPVVIEVGDRSISFRGKIDRADLTDDGSVTVIDYKTGKPGPFEAISADPVDAGRHLQLPIYALAATRLSGSSRSRVRAEFRFVGSRPVKGGGFAIGVELDDAVEARLVETLGILTGTVAAGLFPMVPGRPQWGSYKNCDFCDFNSVCPTGREHYEESARRTGRAEAYFDLIGGLVEDVAQGAGDESEESDE